MGVTAAAAIIGALATVGGAYYSYKSQQDAADEARSQAEKQLAYQKEQAQIQNDLYTKQIAQEKDIAAQQSAAAKEQLNAQKEYTASQQQIAKDNQATALSESLRQSVTPTTESEEVGNVTQSAAEEEKRRRQMYGLSKTKVTQNQGLLSGADANTQQSTLLGG